MDPASLSAAIVAAAVGLPGLIAAIGSSGRRSRRSERLHRARCADWEERHYNTRSDVYEHNEQHHPGRKNPDRMPVPPTPSYLTETSDADDE